MASVMHMASGTTAWQGEKIIIDQQQDFNDMIS
jgi:hypothetical protein